MLIDCLNKKELLLINGVKNNKPHMRVIFGFEDNKILVADPSFAKPLSLSFQELYEISVPSNGFWMVATKSS